MALPKLSRSVMTIVMPSATRSVTFQPMDRRCEKLLLIAKDSKDSVEWVDAVRQVVTNCAIDPSFDVDSLTSFDLEFAFVKLRSASIGNKEVIAYRDTSDGRVYDVEVDLDKVDVIFPAGREPTTIIDVRDSVKMSLHWPLATTWADPAVIRAENPEDALDALIAHCIERVWVGDETYDASGSSREEVIEFLHALDVTTWNKMREWATSVPHLSYWVSWKNSKGDERRVELRTLTDFFTFSSQEEI